MTIDRRTLLGHTVFGWTGIGLLGALPDQALADPAGAKPGHRFAFADAAIPEGFLLDGAPFQIRSGEMHPARIPRIHWRHRIRMAKAMGLNTIAIYLMWNHHELAPGVWDFTSDNRDIAAFIRLCAREGLLVYLRAGPYVCGEWDLGGLPAYLLRDPDIRLRDGGDVRYMAAVARYIGEVARVVRPLMHDRGGPILMVQVENEYASFGKDLAYLDTIRTMWRTAGIEGPFSISDGLKQIQAAQTYLPGTALGLDGDTDFAAARTIAQGAPVWVGEGYPGWLTHWGDPAFASGDYRQTLTMLMQQRISFNLYVVHGGTNFGFGAGANADSDGTNFLPSLTSYDYGAPIDEQGAPTPQYGDLQRIIARATGSTPAPVPALPPAIAFEPVATRPVGSVWDSARVEMAADPQPMETLLHQDQGMVQYVHSLAPGGPGALRIAGLHDEALVLLEGQVIGWLSRVAAAKAPDAVQLPARAVAQRLDILVYPFGRVNYGHYMSDRKGILGAVQLNGVALRGWEVRGLPLDARHLDAMRATPRKFGPALLHEATVVLPRVGDTFIDMTGWGTGFVWVNDRLLGRHCRLGPQTALYCPASWLRSGPNRINVLDLYAAPGLSIAGISRRPGSVAVPAGAG
ncbi:beta-galactosidase [uncultured Sphingomonas sp.]|uniref:beta-galactosidase n=1 Tax=uncultured Sphingomonas sp. TaxID=158754 RepID=UPI0025CCE5B7|nr:beta-galactosidase [uncultured Sphingomonas sp.]